MSGFMSVDRIFYPLINSGMDLMQKRLLETEITTLK